jgi:hypothetical protein
VSGIGHQGACLRYIGYTTCLRRPQPSSTLYCTCTAPVLQLYCTCTALPPPSNRHWPQGCVPIQPARGGLCLQVHPRAWRERALRHRPLHLELGHVAGGEAVPPSVPARQEPGETCDVCVGVACVSGVQCCKRAMWLVARLCPPQFLQDRSQVRCVMFVWFGCCFGLQCWAMWLVARLCPPQILQDRSQVGFMM